MIRPLPWAVVKKLWAPPSTPVSRYEPVSMLPPMITGCPVSRYSAGNPSIPGAKARVAPLRCTSSSRLTPSTRWRSILAVLWVTS